MQPPEAKPYAENHAALTWPLLALGLYGPVAVCAVCVVLACTVSPDWLIGALLLPFQVPFLIYIGILHRNWPSGIRIDAEEVRIGAVASANAARREPTVTRQAWGLFHAPWSAIGHVEVIDDPVRLERLRRKPEYFTLCNRWSKPRTITRCMIGVLTPSFARAVLLLTVEPELVRFPRVGSTVFFPNEIGRPVTAKLVPAASGVWIAPTRHPERLRAAIAAWTGES